MNNKTWLKKGHIEETISSSINIVEEIAKLKREKNAIVMAHYYQTNDIQDIADFVGDSLALAQKAEKTNADIILLAGVHFMGETAKIISPEKKVLVPDLNAGCSLADSCQPRDFEEFLKSYPDHTVVTYVNTSAAIKAFTDVVVTSTNAKAIIDSFPKDEKIVFGPDRNLGNYINSITGRDMILWDGACHVHEKFSLEKILELKKSYPKAQLIAHPECKKSILIAANFIGSTAALLKYTRDSEVGEFIVATESGILHQMQMASPQKNFIPAPPNDSTCACNDCEFMKLNSLQKIYLTLKYEWPEIDIEESIRIKALRPIQKMLELSNKLGL
ncbi:MAG: quinolinate synthase NadA [Breznakibacter sp.]